MKNKFLTAITLLLLICSAANANYVWTGFSEQTGVNINDVLFIGNKGWLAGDSGLLKTSIDGGRTWTNQSSGVNLNIRKISANTDGSVIAALCGAQTVIISLDGGITWINRTPNTVISSDIILNSISVTGNALYAVGVNNIILKSSDWGQIWVKQFEGVRTSNFVRFFNNNYGIVLGDRHILITYNAGADWQFTSTPYNFITAYCYNEYLWFAVTDENRLYQTIEGPARWAFLFTFNFKVNSMYMSSYNDGWAVGDNGNIYQTSPNPANWSKFNIPGYSRNFKLNTVYLFENSDTVFIFGNSGYYYMRTFDYSQSEEQLSRFIFADAGGPYFSVTGETVALTAEKTVARNKNFMRYRWSENYDNAYLFDSDRMNAVFRADKSGIYFVKLSVDDYRGNYSETTAKICVADTFVELNSNDTALDFSGYAALKFNNNNNYNVGLKLKNDFQDLTVSINRVDYAETPYILFVNRVADNLLPSLRPNVSLYEEMNYTIVDFELFDLKTGNNLNRQTFAFDELKLKYSLDSDNGKFANRNFAVFRLDDNLANWSNISGYYLYSVNAGLNIEKTLEHFSIYGMFAQPYFSNDEIFVYPNPFIPNDGNIRTGRYFTGSDDGSGIYFSGRKINNANIKIVNLAGYVVLDARNDAKDYYQWNVKDKRGRAVSSGLYYIIIESDNYKCVKKLQIAN